MALSILEKLRNQLSTPIGHALLENREDDSYIAAFPRSGSTWLRTILVNILDPSAESNPDVFNARIPAVSVRNAKLINALESPRIIMTHSNWRPSINRAVYLVRDGRDAFVSSYHYHVTRQGIELTIDDYYERYINGVYGQTWENHVHAWLEKGMVKLDGDFMLIRFEDLKADTTECVTGICDYLNIDSDARGIERSIEEASLDKAKSIERSRQGEITNNNASFYRSGGTAQWDSPEYETVITRFEEHAQRALSLAGY